MTKKRKVCHLTSVHPRYDTRIFIKECGGLAKNGYETHLVVADGKGDEIKYNIHIHDVGKQSGRFKRILLTPKEVFNQALSLQADIYHFHDPELMKIGKKLVRKGFKVIYDVHEDVPRQILNKSYIPTFLRKGISMLVERYENKIAAKLSGIVTATPFIKERFKEQNANVIAVQNFPILNEFSSDETIKKENGICYIGSISQVRGILNMVDAMQYTKETKLFLGGSFETQELHDKAKLSKGWENVVELGFLNREEVKNNLMKSIAGLVVLEPTISYLDSIPVKMFEYMAAGIPIIASDFKYWRELIEDVDCALFVDPQNPEAIGKAIRTLVENKKMALNMGQRGKSAVHQKFNWKNEETNLINFYKKSLYK